MEHIYPYASEIDSIAHVYSPDVKTLFYMTWGHKNGSQRQTEYLLDDTYSLMQDRIINTYIDLAYELGDGVFRLESHGKKLGQNILRLSYTIPTILTHH